MSIPRALFSPASRSTLSVEAATSVLFTLIAIVSTGFAQSRAESMTDHGDYVEIITTSDTTDPRNWEYELIPKRNVLTVKLARDNPDPTRYALTIHIAEEVPHAKEGARSARSYAVIYGDYEGAMGAAKRFFARKCCCQSPCKPRSGDSGLE